MPENQRQGDVNKPPESEAAVERPPKHYEIDIYRARCKECGICAAFCPRQCLSLDEEGRPIIEKSELCTGCGWCELHCPDFAISVRERLEEKPEEEAD
jgi:2-oxoglutarate ferredoxin oxidoreductase subunit delta